MPNLLQRHLSSILYAHDKGSAGKLPFGNSSPFRHGVEEGKEKQISTKVVNAFSDQYCNGTCKNSDFSLSFTFSFEKVTVLRASTYTLVTANALCHMLVRNEYQF